MRKRIFSIHNRYGEITFWRRYRDGTNAARRVYILNKRLAEFIDRLGAVHGVTEVYDHPAYGGGLMYRAINIKGRYGADWSFDSLTPSAEVKPPTVYTGTPVDWPDEWE